MSSGSPLAFSPTVVIEAIRILSSVVTVEAWVRTFLKICISAWSRLMFVTVRVMKVFVVLKNSHIYAEAHGNESVALKLGCMAFDQRFSPRALTDAECALKLPSSIGPVTTARRRLRRSAEVLWEEHRRCRRRRHFPPRASHSAVFMLH